MITRSEVLEMLREVVDPELMMNIVDLGLVYKVEVGEEKVEIEYTLTTPGCPVGPMIEENIVREVEDGTGLTVEARLVWTPMWGPDYMTDEAKITLGYPI